MRRSRVSVCIAAIVSGVPRKGRSKVATETKTLRVGDPAPDFALRTHAGGDFTLSQHRGKRVVIAFFAFAFTGT